MFVSSSLAHRIDLVEARLVEAIVSRVQQRHPSVGAFAEPVSGGMALFAGLANPVNKVIGIGFDTAPHADDLARVERAFAERGSEVRAEVSTLARAETHETLARRGYILQGFEYVLGRALDNTAIGRETTDPAVDVGPVTATDLDAWVSTVTAGFAAPDHSGAGGDQPLPSGDALDEAFSDIFRAEGLSRYLARVNGDIAGGASMRIDGDVVMLAGATTLLQFRRRGVQRALLEARLRDATRAGCALAVVGTQPGSTSQANVQRQGFALLYARAVLVKGVG